MYPSYLRPRFATSPGCRFPAAYLRLYLALAAMPVNGFPPRRGVSGGGAGGRGAPPRPAGGWRRGRRFVRVAGPAFRVRGAWGIPAGAGIAEGFGGAREAAYPYHAGAADARRWRAAHPRGALPCVAIPTVALQRGAPPCPVGVVAAGWPCHPHGEAGVPRAGGAGPSRRGGHGRRVGRRAASAYPHHFCAADAHAGGRRIRARRFHGRGGRALRCVAGRDARK